VRVLALTVAVCAAVLGTYLALGGADYKPSAVADPCEPREIDWPDGTELVLEQIGKSALDGAACELQVTREDLLIALADPETRADFLDERQISDSELEAALRGGLERAHDDAVEAGALSGIPEFLIAQVIEHAPLEVIVDIAQSETGQELAAKLAEFAGSETAQDAFGTAQEAIAQGQDVLEEGKETIEELEGLVD